MQIVYRHRNALRMLRQIDKRIAEKIGIVLELAERLIAVTAQYSANFFRRVAMIYGKGQRLAVSFRPLRSLANGTNAVLFGKHSIKIGKTDIE